jgi:methyl-accepting chemotaxis protein
VQGLEEGRGGFGFRVVMPVFYRGGHVGSVEYGPGLNSSLLEKWKSQMGGEYYIYSKGRTGVALENNRDGLLVSTLKEDKVKISEQVLDKIMQTGKPETLLLDRAQKAALIIPLADYSGKSIGYLKIINDRSEIIHKLNRDLQSAIVTAVIALLILLVATFFIVTVITGPVIKLSNTVEAVSRGDLTKEVGAIKSRDEIGVLALSCQKMMNNLKIMITDIQKNANKLATYSQELASSSQEVSASMEEVAGAVDEFAAVSTRGVANAEAAVLESEEVKRIAGEGNQAVRETIDKINSIADATANISSAVQKLNEQSTRIGEIIVSITVIADQTNLLALNAAIEAARAGEHGRGFAVVAEEVRLLAEQSARAAGEITGLVKEIQAGVGEVISAMERGGREVNEGVRIAQTAGVSLKQIIEAVDKNTVMIREIATAVRRVNDGTQQLAAASEEIASNMQQVSGAAQELSRIADELEQSSDKFILDNKDPA